MKLNQILQSIFISLILIGLFATMAQNAYGSTLIGSACFGLSLLFVAQGFWNLLEDFSHLERNDIFGILELFFLASLLLLFGMRAFYIRPAHVDIIFILICALLAVTYFFIASRIFVVAKKENPDLALKVRLFYLSVIIFLVSLGIRILSPTLSIVLGGLAVLPIVPVLISIARQKKYDYSGKSISLFQFIVHVKNKAGLLLLFFLFSGIYVSLSKMNIIPAIENAEKPRTYIEFVNNAENGSEKPIDGKYRHEHYKDAMDKFLERHGTLHE